MLRVKVIENNNVVSGIGSSAINTALESLQGTMITIRDIKYFADTEGVVQTAVIEYDDRRG